MKPTWVTYALLGYFGFGILISLTFALKRRKTKEGLNPAFFLSEPLLGGWLLFLLWPIWLVMMLVDDKAVEKAAPQEHITNDVLGKTGIVVLEPMPVGRIKIGNILYDATSPHKPLPVGSIVVVTGRKLGELTVERTD